ncbi:ArnT family glycosyltransferase [Streptomyces sp. SP17KL33]|uniref:ArnT family glycosyltransferase n=1 Tax=Streptomyces sp. SP17KL33 TaxID=3002534 RepID=UPI002E78CB11|nr:glycosyltransferase family 39 protein [Streptomyces sp. SP17KL33]MEE1835530.1 glycosyltransferase family 39 protein [Streptomyces sp. SP17KL33]
MNEKNAATLAPPRHRADTPSAAGATGAAAAAGAAGDRGGLAVRVRRLFTGAPEDPRWARPALWAILVLATALYAWNLSSVTGNTFYNAAVYSGTKSWKAFFFGALDAGSFITVDKPPFALWVMGLSARVFGYGTWQLLLPMVAVGVGSVALLYRMVKRDFGAVAGTIAALALTLTPITVALTRDTNPDPILVFLMLLGAAALMKAVRTGRLMPLVWSGVAIGFAFNTKMMQAYVVLPVFFLVYLWAANASLGRRVRNLAVGTVALVVSSAWWMVVVDLIPASSRPYIGGSTDNTVWDLVIGYNGFGRIFGASASAGSQGNGASFGGEASVYRMFNEIMGGQISWLIPFAIVALVGGLVLRGRAPRTDTKRAALLLWGGWFVLHYLTFALAEGTFHPYYVTAMAPGVAALAGAGGVMLYGAFKEGPVAMGVPPLDRSREWGKGWVLPPAVAASAVWAVVLLQRVSGSGTVYTVAQVVAGVAGAVAVIGLVVGRFMRRRKLIGLASIAAVVALLAGPTAYSLSAATTASTNGTNPTAGPSTGGGMGGGGGMGDGQRPSGNAPGATGNSGSTGSTGSGTSNSGRGGMGGGSQVSAEMITYLKENQDGATWLVAVATDQTASSIILESGEPVISMGGWSGSDEAMTLAKLKALVKAGKLHYIVVGDSGRGGNSTAAIEVAEWVKENGSAVSDYSGLYRLDASDVS